LGLAHVDEGKITGQLAIRQVFEKNRKMARTDGPDDITIYTGATDRVYYTVDTALVRIEAIVEDMLAEDGTAVAARG
jgi:hypothetical protein